MNSARQSILEKIGRSSLDGTWPVEPLIPRHVQRSQPDLVQMFIEKVHGSRASTEIASTVNEVPLRVAALIADRESARDIVVSEVLDNLPWGEAGIQHGALDLSKDGIIAITDCFAGVAETGTIVCLSHGGRDSRLNFVSQLQIVVLEASSIVGPYEDIWTMMHDKTISIPRAVNFITGPSRTADIEQTIELGAHGPGEVHIIIIDPKGEKMA